MFHALELCIKYNKCTNYYFDPRIIGNLEKIGYDKNFKGNDFNTDGSIDVAFEKCEKNLCQDIILDRNKKTALLKKRIDTSGVVKGLTVDKATDYLSRKGFRDFIVEAGGDIYAAGLDEKNNNWRVDIEGVSEKQIMLKLKNEGIATSGIGKKRWVKGGKKVHHLINPKDPENFICDLRCVTVIGKCTAEADVWAKSLFLMGKDTGLKFAESKEMKAIFLDYRGNAFLTKAIKENLI
jgi:thiamine biosynthesis lipoprotein